MVMRIKSNEFLNNLSYIFVHKKKTVFLRYATFGEYISLKLYTVICNTHIGSTLVRFQMVSLEFFIDIILPIALWPWGRLSI